MEKLDDAFERIKHETQVIYKSKLIIASSENIIRESIVEWRKDRLMTQKAFAEQLGISKMYLSDIENGKRKLSSRVLKKLYEVVV